jgi:hypothetical protein
VVYGWGKRGDICGHFLNSPTPVLDYSILTAQIIEVTGLQYSKRLSYKGSFPSILGGCVAGALHCKTETSVEYSQE